MASPVETEAMRRAIELAAEALGDTSPNPPVGCVILDAGGTVVGEGCSSPAGGPHAEVNALARAGRRCRGGTAVVTLEPCAHHGRTPPCTDALVAAGVARVVYAVPDPNPMASGGANLLRAAGIEVESGVLHVEAARGNEAWLTALRRGRPFVTWKYGASLDGRVAAADRSSRWITGPESRADAHRLRAESDAVIVGSGTMRADDPHLAARDFPARRQPLRVVVDTAARTPTTARVLDGAAPTLIAVAADADAARLERVTEVLRLPRSAAGLDLDALLAALYARGARGVLLEGGPTLAAAFVAAGLVDRVVAYVAPVLIGGEGRPALDRTGFLTLTDASRFRLDDVSRFGADVRLTARAS